MGNKDNWQTPKIAVDYLAPYISNGVHRIWEPASGQGILADSLARHGYEVYPTDILWGKDFFKYSPRCKIDAIITNPPYSITDKWIRHCIRLGGRFALLTPLYVLHSKVRCDYFRRNPIQLVIPPQRINFIDPDNDNKESSAPWAVAWFCYGFRLEKDINYPRTLEKDTK